MRKNAEALVDLERWASFVHLYYHVVSLATYVSSLRRFHGLSRSDDLKIGPQSAI